jgi:heme-degrading monooxygenase HmoA
VIARVWSARAAPGRAREYARYLHTHVFADLKALEGYERGLLLERHADGVVEVRVITFWRSLDAIRAFAGADVEAAVVTDRAAAMLLDYDRRARHFEVVLDEAANLAT